MPPQMTRLMIIFGLLIASFVVVRMVSKPDSFSWYGHYRGAALAEQAQKEFTYASVGQCGDCHDGEAAENHAGRHSVLSCQTCHGPGLAHLNDPTAENITRPIVTETCLGCHQRNKARPDGFPQIIPDDHSDGMACNECHLVHNPGDFQ